MSDDKLQTATKTCRNIMLRETEKNLVEIADMLESIEGVARELPNFHIFIKDAIMKEDAINNEENIRLREIEKFKTRMKRYNLLFDLSDEIREETKSSQNALIRSYQKVEDLLKELRETGEK
jgi:ABC-type phosphate transport system auxiliary subunit